MPRLIAAAQRQLAIDMMMHGEPQREICRITGLSRPYLRKLAKTVGYQFPRNGIEVVGNLCMCTNCGSFYRRPQSKMNRAKHSFCCEICRIAWQKGSNHPAWKTGDSSRTFSDWVRNQSGYTKWRDTVLERDGHRCVVSGRTDKLHAHHILPKAEGMNPERAFDVSNGITLCEDVHIEIHELIRSGVDFDEALLTLKNKYNNTSSVYVGVDIGGEPNAISEKE